ncbi:MAG: cysteine desulfurase [Gammaproteobacteria bacterium]|nr:cysteine desulfurase [Gammaproteobacteria bacterium]
MTTSKAEKPANVGFAVEQFRKDFPILQQSVHGHPLAFLDNAASSQRPGVVIDSIRHYYEHDHANVHRGVHTLSHRATEAYEGAREKIRAFINADSTREIVFTRGTTEAINLIATSFGSLLGEGDEIIISHLEHHSNIVPWQMLCDRSGAELKVIPMNDRGEILFDEFTALLGPRTRLLAIAHVSNALGTIVPVEKFIAAAKERDIPVLLDGAQAVPHQGVDVTALGCDFYAFSGHKMFGPTGIGVLYGREQWLEKLPPYQGGGDMILSVSFRGTIFNELPYKFEAGTPHIAGAIGLGVAVDYLRDIGMDRINQYEASLLDYATKAISAVDGVRLFGTAEKKAGVISFNLDDIHPHDLGTVLDHQGVAIRTGHHCAMPVMEYFGIAGTARASLAFYNNEQDIDQLVSGLHQAIKMFR